MPDRVEKIGRFRIFGHRPLTHELLLWLIPFVTFLLLPVLCKSMAGAAVNLSPLGTLGFTHVIPLRSWILFLPGLIHLAGDVMTPRGIHKLHWLNIRIPCVRVPAKYHLKLLGYRSRQRLRPSDFWLR